MTERTRAELRGLWIGFLFGIVAMRLHVLDWLWRYAK